MEEGIGVSFTRLVSIMDELRAKCPWDQQQTAASLRSLTIEEMYELADAITRQDWEGIREELGDVLLHIVFYARIFLEDGKFTLKDVIDGICEKLIFRHPHIYGKIEPEDQLVQVHTEQDVRQNWEKLKKKEGKKSTLHGVPIALPSLVKAIRLQEKAKQVGFEWEGINQVWAKVLEEMQELQEVANQNDQARKEEELGDLIFSIVNYARFLHVDPENALEKTNKKFIERFNAMEHFALSQGKELSEMTLLEMDDIWDSIKNQKSLH